MSAARSGRWRESFVESLTRRWWRPSPTVLTTLLRPLALLYGAVARRQRRLAVALRAPVPLLVVGNIVVGGAGKTPTVIAIVQALQAAGRRPGVISRGYGSSSTDGDVARPVRPGDDPLQVGDEPLLIAGRTGVPVWVGRQRSAAALDLCAAEPQVDVIVSDDGLQHHRLARDAELIVFDDRGAGNGLLLPAGPLREALPVRLAPGQRVLYTGTRASTALPGYRAQRTADRAWLLADWRGGAFVAQTAISSVNGPERKGAIPLTELRGRPLLAVAGLADPAKFHDMLLAAGLQIEPLALPDHHPYPELPWPPDTPDVITTEKDAVKLDPARLPGLRATRTRVWVVPLDLALPAQLVDELLALLPASSRPVPPRLVPYGASDDRIN